MIFLKDVRIFAIFWGQKSEMMDEMGRDGFKFGIFDMGRCALISGPQKCWFWPIPGEPGGACLGEPGGAATWTQHINKKSKNPISRA